MNYLARGPHCFGMGKTREEAVKNAKKFFPYRYVPSVKRAADKHFSIYTSEGDFTVSDDVGFITSTKDDIQQIQKSILAD